MFCRFRAGLAVTGLVLAIFLATNAPQAQAPAQYTNLQYFPKTISRDELIGTMRRFCFSLNVRCQYCHAGTDKDTNFASDEKEAKRTARNMLRMVDAINQDYLAKMGRTTSTKVECVTCHHGLSIPRTMDGLLAETLEKKDIPAAIAQYRDLRKKAYGYGQYDFGETPLNQLAENLLKQHKTKEAVAIMELNVEVNTPPSGWSYSVLAMAHQANQEIEKAKADYRKILELNPQNDWAKKQLDELNNPKQ